jgi:3-phenylpropionate/trans-cinnamate dioxygenase ferredoxin reductase subunit
MRIAREQTMAVQQPVVIVGAGHAGFQLAVSLRQAGFQEPIELVNDEPLLPYQRPPLSKAHLKSGGGVEAILFRPEKFYADQRITLLSERVVAIDRSRRAVRFASGTSRAYGHLVLATGARNRLLDIPNAGLDGVMYLRSFAESEALRARLVAGKRAVVVGAGFIGLEFAATARAKGLEVDVLELAPRVMARAVTPEISAYFERKHAEAGIRLHFGVGATEIEGAGGRVTGISLTDGRQLPADLVVVGVGVLPNVELAAEAGLPVASGIIVDRQLRTADPDISAIGDCALYESARFGVPLRLESVQNATDHARCVAMRLAGKPEDYDGVPWFWSDQGSDKLQMAGLTAGFDRSVLRGDPEQDAFSAFCFKNGKLIGVESVNRAGDHVFARRALGANKSITPEQAADLSFDLKKAMA